MKYRYIIFDADHTLIDFNRDERRAFRTAFEACNVSYSEQTVEECWRYSAENWGQVGLHDVHRPEIRSAYHELYREHIRRLFDRVGEIVGLGEKREEVCRIFEQALAYPSHPIEGALETVRALSARYRICVATNGLSFMQHGRLKEFEPFLVKEFVSEEMGCIKPDERYFRIMMDDLGTSARECLMVGDSLTTDIAGASGVGMDSIWFNRTGTALPAGSSPVAQIAALSELLAWLGES